MTLHLMRRIRYDMRSASLLAEPRQWLERERLEREQAAQRPEKEDDNDE
jgi:hypothetical protein